MKIEEIEEYLEKTVPIILEGQMVYSVSFVAGYQAKINSYINQLAADKLEAYNKIVHLDNGLKAMTNIVCCEKYRCSLPDNKQHDEDCIVNKAQKYIEEVEK